MCLISFPIPVPQGEVEQIAMMKPKGQAEGDEGLLEYFEDIIGSDRFKTDIEEKGKQLEQLNETWSDKLNRVKVIMFLTTPCLLKCLLVNAHNLNGIIHKHKLQGYGIGIYNMNNRRKIIIT